MSIDVVIGGFGGQGVLLTGLVLANAGLLEGSHVTWLPSYGPEMRGGTAHCTVVISSTPVLSPLVARPGAVIALNRPSAERFAPILKANGLLLVDSSLVEAHPTRKDLRVIKIPARRAAEQLGDVTVANMVALGGYLETERVVSFDSALESLRSLVGTRKPELVQLNEQALKDGWMLAADMGSGALEK
jgi:2-oxoglutarate ferredoxin oxidoreductase subunit gamma